MRYDDRYFDEQFSGYDGKYGNGWGMNWRAYMYLRAEKVAEIVRKHLRNLGSKSNILEVGCATGDFLDLYLDDLKKYNGKVLGGDISLEAVKICQNKYINNDNISFEKMVLPNIDLKRKFNCVICMDVLEYFENSQKMKCIDNLFEHLETEGQLIIQIPLERECEEEIINLIEKKYKIQNIHYVYGDIWYKLVEKYGVSIIIALLKEQKWGFLGAFIGKIGFEILKSKKIVGKAFEINEKFFPSRKSHIIICING